MTHRHTSECAVFCRCPSVDRTTGEFLFAHHAGAPVLVDLWPVRPYHFEPSESALKAYSERAQVLLQRIDS